MDEALLEKQREAYAVAGVDESQTAEPPSKKRKQPTAADGGVGYASKSEAFFPLLTRCPQENGGGHLKKNKAGQGPSSRKNTAIYVTNLPPDATAEEVRSVFSKCGVIAEEIDQGRPRIKLYTDDQGRFKGDALIVYFRAESVMLATQMLDETDFRFSEAGSSGKMRVQAADFSYKTQQEAPTKSNTRDKKKIIRKTQKLNKSVFPPPNFKHWSLGGTRRLTSIAVSSRIGMTMTRPHCTTQARAGTRSSS